MILPFKPQFVQPIMDGTKIHTIREDKLQRWKPGMTIHMATGVRTPAYHCFKEMVCVSVQTIEIDLTGLIMIKIDGRQLMQFVETNTVAENDGFKNIIGFRNWFAETYEDKVFVGRIIQWTDFKYYSL